LAVIGIAAALLTPVIPSMMGLGVSIALLGAGMALAGVGILAFAAGLAALGVAAAAGVAGLKILVVGILELIPEIIEILGKIIVGLAKAITDAGPAVVASIVAVLGAFLDAIVKLAPKAGRALMAMITLLLNVLQQAIPKMVRAGLNIVVGILNGIAANIGRIVTAATNIIVNFLNGIGKNLPRIIDSGVRLIISFVNGMAKAIRSNQTAMNEAGRNLASAIVEGMVSGIGSGIRAVTTAARNLAKSALNAAKSFLGINSPSKEFQKLGQYSGDGYAKGLDGSKDQINAAAKTMQNLISTAMQNAVADVKALEKRLKTLKNARKKDTAAIRETVAALAQARAEVKRTTNAGKIASTFGDEISKLNKLSDQASAIVEKLKEANKALEEATKTRDDYNKSIAGQFGNLADPEKDTKLPEYIKNLQKQIVDTQIFTAQLQKLREMGLNDDMYKELLAKGIDATPFITQILNGGQTSVNELNTLNSALQTSAQSLGSSASTALYQAGVDAAAGLVKGLENQQAAIEAQMDKIALSMVAAIKRALGIKSPSREFMEIGDWSMKGLALGLQKNTMVVEAAEDVGHNAIEAMRKTMKDMSSKVGAEVDINPAIKPVLDLTDVKKEAATLGAILKTEPLNVSSAYSSAKSTMSAIQASERAREVANENAAFLRDEPKAPVVFNQNNYSPKALPPSEIYRNTKSLISKAKGALTSTPS